jgi:ankyrin repeat protein
MYDALSRTPLHWASVLGLADVAALLLQAGATAGMPDDSGATPLHYAAQHDVTDCVAMMLQFPQVQDAADNDGRSVVMWASGKGNTETLDLLLQRADFDARHPDNTGSTALHVAAQNGHDACVRLLLTRGAEVNAIDQVG